MPVLADQPTCPVDGSNVMWNVVPSGAVKSPALGSSTATVASMLMPYGAMSALISEQVVTFTPSTTIGLTPSALGGSAASVAPLNNNASAAHRRPTLVRKVSMI